MNLCLHLQIFLQLPYNIFISISKKSDTDTDLAFRYLKYLSTLYKVQTKQE